MDLSLIISIVAIVVSVSISTITLFLTEFRGPNISLLKIPEFEISDEDFNETQIKDWTPRWFETKPVTFVFANHGGKAGTVLDLKLDFTPHASLKVFMDSIYFSFEPKPPVTIEEGDNQCFITQLRIRTVDWKEKALAEVLDTSLKVEDMIERALESGKEKFKRFCDFLDNSQELGKLSCTITLTKGRFRTRIREEKLFEKITVANHYKRAVPSLKGCLGRWENSRTTRIDLLNEMKRDLEELIRELNQNTVVLGKSVDEQNIGASRLKTDIWDRLNKIWIPDERKIRWFLIKSEEGLEQDLTKLYRNIEKYNSSIDELSSLGELRSEKHFQKINVERDKMYLGVLKMWERVSRLHKRSIS